RQLVEHLRLHRRGDGRRGRPRDGGHQDPALRLGARRGDDHQPDDRGGPDLRRRAPRPGRRPVRGAAVRRRRAVSDGLLHGLPGAHGLRGARHGHRARRLPLAADPAGLQGARRVQLHDRPRRDRECRERCAGAARSADHRAAHGADTALGADRARQAGERPPPPVKPVRFDYHRPATVEEAIALLTRYGGEAKLLAGGQSLMPLMNFRVARPAALIDLNAIASLAYIREDDGHVRLGAMTRQRAIEFSPVVRQRLPLLAEATALVGHLPIRTRGTIGGSLAHADPSAEYPATLTPAVIEAAARRAAELVEPDTDIHASAAYRRNLTRVLTGRALRRAFARLGGR